MIELNEWGMLSGTHINKKATQGGHDINGSVDVLNIMNSHVCAS